jgi:hypothetical protein
MSSSITDTACEFLCGRKAKCHNAVSTGDQYILHGSVICTRNPDDTLVFDWCGYYTTTTANHMNHILWAHGAGFRVGYATARNERHTTFEVR